MCDNDGIYSFKNGNEYRGNFKTCSKLMINKYGCFEGQGVLKISGIGSFTGNFKNGHADGPGKFDIINGETHEAIWNNSSIIELVKRK